MQEEQIKKQLEQLRKDMVFVEGGSFMMGSEKYEKTLPIRDVEVREFFIGKYLVSQLLWQSFMNSNPSFFRGINRPVESVSWVDAQNFIDKLNSFSKYRGGLYYRLPSEAEWEYAARGGKQYNHQNLEYSGSNNINEVAWHYQNCNEETKILGLKFSNDIGIYDMSGHVWEWCEDVWHDNYRRAPLFGRPWRLNGVSVRRVIRGGGWRHGLKKLAVYSRDKYIPYHNNSDIGFRLAADFV